MYRRLIYSGFVFTLFAIGVSVQDAEPSPTPRPAPRRPALDQFGLSSGVFSVPVQSTSPTAVAPPQKAEYVDQTTFDTVNQLIENSDFMVREYSQAVRDKVDMSPSSKFAAYFIHHMIGIAVVSEGQRHGTFGSSGIKGIWLSSLLQQNEVSAMQIVAVLNTPPADSARLPEKVNAVAASAGVPFPKVPTDGPVDKATLINAILTRMNSNYGIVKRIMTVKP